MKRIINTLAAKWPEYLIEAIVIVLSILGAFWLDSWKETTSKLESRKSYLESLSKNLLADSSQIQLVIENNARLMSRLDSALLMTKGKIDFNSTSFNKHISSLIYTVDYRQNRMTFDNLVNSGKIELLNDIHLVEMLYGYYNPNKSVHRFSESILHYSRNIYGPLYIKIGIVNPKDNAVLEKDVGRDLLTNKELINCLENKSWQCSEHMRLLKEQELTEVQLLLKAIKNSQS